MLTCFGANDFATLKHFRPKHFLRESLMQTCFRGNDFAIIKFFDQKIFKENFSSIPVFQEMILQPLKFLTKTFQSKCFMKTCFRENDFATIQIFRPKKFYKMLWINPIFEEMIMQP